MTFYLLFSKMGQLRRQRRKKRREEEEEEEELGKGLYVCRGVHVRHVNCPGTGARSNIQDILWVLVDRRPVEATAKKHGRHVVLEVHALDFLLKAKVSQLPPKHKQDSGYANNIVIPRRLEKRSLHTGE